ETNRRVASLLSLLGWLALLPGQPVIAGETWLDVDTGKLTLSVMDGEVVSRTFEGIAIGRNGVSSFRQVGDQTTPLGSFRIRRIKTDSRYHLFFGFDYPNMDQATAALRAKRITSEQWQAINLAHIQGREPPANTPLGGYIGIHGIGSGDPAIHEDFNWTEGCIALTNEQIDELARSVKVGTRVVVR
ncbi:MAG TPA: L,D-transpeptidase, partial [Xanthomonadales bacterium]|nr:L,D-transpeptidase [Xanthomonadales bacterium]